MHAPDDRTPALVATVVVAALTLLSRDAEEPDAEERRVPRILDVIDLAAAEQGQGHLRKNGPRAPSDTDPAAPSGLVRFEGVGATAADTAFTSVAVLYTALRACEHLPAHARGLYLRVARVVLRNLHADALGAHAALEDDRALLLPLGRVLELYERIDGRIDAAKAAERAERCANAMHAFLTSAAKEENAAHEAAMRSVSSALAALKIVAGA